MTTDILCTACGEVGAPKAGRCAACGSNDVLPADAPVARKFIEDRKARLAAKAVSGHASLRAEATGKVLGRALGKLIGK
jgi:predicted ATP-dependent serine protease